MTDKFDREYLSKLKYVWKYYYNDTTNTVHAERYKIIYINTVYVYFKVPGQRALTCELLSDVHVTIPPEGIFDKKQIYVFFPKIEDIDLVKLVLIGKQEDLIRDLESRKQNAELSRDTFQKRVKAIQKEIDFEERKLEDIKNATYKPEVDHDKLG